MNTFEFIWCLKDYVCVRFMWHTKILFWLSSDSYWLNSDYESDHRWQVDDPKVTRCNCAAWKQHCIWQGNNHENWEKQKCLSCPFLVSFIFLSGEHLKFLLKMNISQVQNIQLSQEISLLPLLTAVVTPFWLLGYMGLGLAKATTFFLNIHKA